MPEIPDNVADFLKAARTVPSGEKTISVSHADAEAAFDVTARGIFDAIRVTVADFAKKNREQHGDEQGALGNHYGQAMIAGECEALCITLEAYAASLAVGDLDTRAHETAKLVAMCVQRLTESARDGVRLGEQLRKERSKE